VWPAVPEFDPNECSAEFRDVPEMPRALAEWDRYRRTGMKAAIFILIPVAIICALVFRDRQPPQDQPPPKSALFALPAGRTNPSLVRLGNKWPIPKGTEVWWSTNQSPAGVVVESEKNHEFEGGVGDGVAIRFNDGSSITWVPTRSIKSFWIRADEAK
jgi:hypothetical protein